MLYIDQVLLSRGLTGFFVDDQPAIKMGASLDGFFFPGQPTTPGYQTIRQKGEVVSIQLLLSDGQIAQGDCAQVQYTGVAGRESLMTYQEMAQIIKDITPQLKNRELGCFREMMKGFDLPKAVAYGLSQALLDGVAKSQKTIMAQVIAQEWGLKPKWEMVPIFTQSGEERYIGVDKMILKDVPILPHGLINNLDNKIGYQGEKLLEYVQWVANRIKTWGKTYYQPILHIDVYGLIGQMFANDLEQVALYLQDLAHQAQPYKLRIESPVDLGSKKAQIQGMAKLKNILAQRCIPVEIVADEWCNDLDDIREFALSADMIQIKTPDLGGVENSIQGVLDCQKAGVGAYLGGTCNETDVSAKVCVHIALATQPQQMLAKPGMGVDEALSIVYNEMRRALAYLSLRGASS